MIVFSLKQQIPSFSEKTFLTLVTRGSVGFFSPPFFLLLLKKKIITFHLKWDKNARDMLFCLLLLASPGPVDNIPCHVIGLQPNVDPLCPWSCPSIDRDVHLEVGGPLSKCISKMASTASASPLNLWPWCSEPVTKTLALSSMQTVNGMKVSQNALNMGHYFLLAGKDKRTKHKECRGPTNSSWRQQSAISSTPTLWEC